MVATFFSAPDWKLRVVIGFAVVPRSLLPISNIPPARVTDELDAPLPPVVSPRTISPVMVSMPPLRTREAVAFLLEDDFLKLMFEPDGGFAVVHL